jgi:REP element-mobilizing transposase RayT
MPENNLLAIKQEKKRPSGPRVRLAMIALCLQVWKFRKSDSLVFSYFAVERFMIAAMHRFPTRLLAYCLMPNHWHMVLWPRKDGEVTAFLRWLTLTHSQRLYAASHDGLGAYLSGAIQKFSD